MARDQLPDIIILDLKIPKPDGFEVTTILKDNFRTAHTPIFMLTGVWPKTEDKVGGLLMGADDYMTKRSGSLFVICNLVFGIS